ncbi:MAG TPA: ParA family protein [Pseudomonadales bacterium]|jgi:chromosome partitioning protein|nr:ParA family protein [Pseudomonadales bacterium]HNN86734.1 ParA family protein [Pseudomonadales bacterium]
MKRVVFNQKGGVGKTSISCNLAAISAQQGYKTLLIDLDTQCNSSEYLLGANYAEKNKTSLDFFKSFLGVFSGKPYLPNFCHPTHFKNLSVMPASSDLSNIERELESKHKIYKFRDALKEAEKHYDRIYIDTPPALNFYSMAALIAADSLLIPFDCDSFSRQALYNLVNTVAEIREDHNEGLKIEGVVVNQFNPQAKFPQELIDQLIADGLPVLDAYLNTSIKVKESREEHTPLVYFAPAHKATQQFINLYQKLESIEV